MKRYHVIGLALLAGFVFGCAVPAKASSISCVKDGVKGDAKEVVIFSNDTGFLIESVINVKDGSTKQGLAYFRASDLTDTKDGKAQVVLFTTRQKGQDINSAADGVAIYFRKDTHEITLSKWHNNGKDVISKQVNFYCAALDEAE